jgi:tripartite-type tricarboxylate transporter receptor subunit TctC
MTLGRIAAGVSALICLLGSAVSAPAQDFTAKNVNLVVGFPPGGGYDTIARIFARWYGRHLPGNPSVVVQNQPGAGSLTVANLLFNTAPKDGSQIAMFASSAAVEPLMGNQAAKFDASKFEWIGNLNRDTPACGAWKNSGITSLDDVMKKKTRFGASGPAAITAQHAFFLKNVLGADIQVIMGLGGTGPIVLAMQRGEVDASCGMFISSVRGSFRSDYEQGNLIIFVQFGMKSVPYFKNAPNIYDVVKPADKQLAEFVFSQAEITRPLALPPGTSEKIVAAMRAGFDKAVRDPEYLADLQKAQIEAEPMSGTETAAAFKAAIAAPPEVIARSKGVLGPPN